MKRDNRKPKPSQGGGMIRNLVKYLDHKNPDPNLKNIFYKISTGGKVQKQKLQTFLQQRYKDGFGLKIYRVLALE